MPEIATLTVTLDDSGRAEIDEVYGEELERRAAKIAKLKRRKRSDAKLIERLREMVTEQEDDTRSVLEGNDRLRVATGEAKAKARAAEELNKYLQEDVVELTAALIRTREELHTEKQARDELSECVEEFTPLVREGREAIEELKEVNAKYGDLVVRYEQLRREPLAVKANGATYTLDLNHDGRAALTIASDDHTATLTF